MDSNEALTTAGRGCEWAEEGTKVPVEAVVGCLAGNVERGEEVVAQGKGWAAAETEKAVGLAEGQVLEKRTRGRSRILSCPCSEHAGAYLHDKQTAVDESQFNANQIYSQKEVGALT